MRAMRACQPNEDGFAERDGVKLHYEVFGAGEPTVLLLPTWSIIHSRHWKLQVPDLARRHRVVTFDGRGNGRSDRPAGAEAYRPSEFAADALAVMDATGTDEAVLVALSAGSFWALELGAFHPDRVAGIVFTGAALPLATLPEREVHSFTERLDITEGWAKFNQHYWREHYREFLEFFFGNVFHEAHSTKPIEDAVAWGLETDAETLIATNLARALSGSVTNREGAEAAARKLRCPVLVVHGDQDKIRPHATAVRLAELSGGQLVTMEGSGHAPHVRDPVRFNLVLREFIASLGPPAGQRPSRSWGHALRRRPRALYVSSPIGLGHARRDVAIAKQLRALRPELEIDWLAQDPVTRVLAAEGERVHPASALLANESAHIESEATGHDLHAFQAIRRMDEILLSNFMVFNDLVADGAYDLVVGDEAWDVDRLLHENPELKRTAFTWMTDFVGWLPMPDGGSRESYLTADQNAEMIEQIARFPRVRDRAIFVGDPEDVVPERFGPDLPEIREWTGAHYDFCGYITGYDPAELADTERLRAELGYRPDERVCVVTVGGSGVGGPLLRKVIAAYPLAKRALPELRMIMVAGPRIDPASLPEMPGLDVRAFVPDLYRHLAACDLAVVQGGLATTMELTANRRPFLYFPLAHHFEQRFHVAYRLDRYRAGRRMDYEGSDPDAIAAAIAEEAGRPVDYLPVETDGAERAARAIAGLL
jgi:pimeloyl-ACP methyl ester carboxylesterase/predicted glycosyltransferase